jgi:hypothetical protein
MASAVRGRTWRVAYTRWLEQHNQSREKMATRATTQRNPHAYFYGTPLTREDYLNSRMVAYPFACSIATSRYKGRSRSC